MALLNLGLYTFTADSIWKEVVISEISKGIAKANTSKLSLVLNSEKGLFWVYQ